ncbi:MAG: thioredoxin [Pseudomonadota bacterium]
MTGAHVVDLDEARFAHEVLGAERPVLVDFWATWCGPCVALAPTLDRLASDFAGNVKVAKVDIDKAPRVAAQYGVRGVPNVIIFKAGEPVTRIVGAQTHAAYKQILDGILVGANADALADARVQNPEDRLGFLLSASVADIRGVFERHSGLSTAPIKDRLTPLGIALRHGLPTDKKELFASYISPLSFDELIGLGRIAEARAALETNPELIHQPAADGMSPLMVAILNGQNEAIELLLSVGADPNWAGHDVSDIAPIEMAVFQKNSVLVEQLLDLGADIKRKTHRDGGTLLHLAAMVTDKDVIELLISRGLDPSETNTDGETPYEANVQALTKTLAEETLPPKIELAQQRLEQLRALKPLLTSLK